MTKEIISFLKPRLALLLAAAMLISMIPVSAFAAETTVPETTWESQVTGSFIEAASDLESYTHYSVVDGEAVPETVTIDTTATLGSKENPIAISSPEELILFGQAAAGGYAATSNPTYGKYYILTQDTYDMGAHSMLALSASVYYPSGGISYFGFYGTLIGNGATIQNAYIVGGTRTIQYSNTTIQPALFSALNGRIWDLTLDSCTASGGSGTMGMLYAATNGLSEDAIINCNIIDGQILPGSGTTSISLLGSAAVNSQADVTLGCDHTLRSDLTLNSGETLTIPEGVTLTVPERRTLTLFDSNSLVNNGTIVKEGTITCSAHNVDETTGVCAVCGNTLVARVGQTYYATVSDAVSAAHSYDETVTVFKDATVTSSVTVDSSDIKIEMVNGATVTVADGGKLELRGRTNGCDGVVSEAEGYVAPYPFSYGYIYSSLEKMMVNCNYGVMVRATVNSDASISQAISMSNSSELTIPQGVTVTLNKPLTLGSGTSLINNGKLILAEGGSIVNNGGTATCGESSGHAYLEGVCQICGNVCAHTGDATCAEPVTCTLCGQVYQPAHTPNEAGDACDVCGVAMYRVSKYEEDDRLRFLLFQGPDCAFEGQDYVGRIIVDPDYGVTKSTDFNFEVWVDGVQITEYRFYNTVLTVPAHLVTGDILITCDGDLQKEPDTPLGSCPGVVAGSLSHDGFDWAADYSSCTIRACCGLCDEIFEYTHTPGVTTTEATCTQTGKTVYSVSFRDLSDSKEVILPIDESNHDYVDGVCARCGEKLYPIFLGGVQISDDNASDILGDGTASYDAQTGTLTLNGTTVDASALGVPALEITGGTVTLALQGTNALTGSVQVQSATDEAGNTTWYGEPAISITEGAALIITGDEAATLTLMGNDFAYTANDHIPSATSISGGSLTVAGGTITTNNGIRLTGDYSQTGGSVDAGFLEAQNVTVSDGILNARGYSGIEPRYLDSSAGGIHGIFARETITVSGGTVTSFSGVVGHNGDYRGAHQVTGETITTHGLYALESISITGGSVTSTGCQGGYVIGDMGELTMGNWEGEERVGPSAGAALEAPDWSISAEATFICGSDASHRDGIATCVDPLACQFCGVERGELDAGNHAGPYTAQYKWYPHTDGTCYVYAELYCDGCGEYVDDTSDYAELIEDVAPVNCQNPGSRTWSFTCTFNGEQYSEIHTETVYNDVHIVFDGNGFCTSCGGYQKPTVDPGEDAEWDYDDVYLIYNVGQLYWFADYVNNVNNGITGKLMTDIDLNPGYTFYADGTYTGGDSPRMWTPIGTGYPCYAGSFDGNGFTVSGAYAVSEGSYVGLFGNTDYNYTIENLGITNSYFKGADHVGGLIGYAYTTVKNCYVTDTVYVSGSYDTAAFIGYSGGEIINCYAMADTFVDSNYGSCYNCYAMTEGDGTTALTAEDFASGKAAYLLQTNLYGEDIYDEETGEVTGTNHIWGQSIGEDAYPVLGGETVYRLQDCSKGTISYSNEYQPVHHIFDAVTGECICGLQTQTGVSVTIGDTTTNFRLLGDALQAVKDCTAEDQATVKLLVNIDLKDSWQTISSGEFTFDLNGCELIGSGVVLTIKGTNVTITDSGVGGTIFSDSIGVRVRDHGTVTIAGGTIIAAMRGVVGEWGTMIIAGGTISGGHLDISSSSSTLIMTVEEGKTEGATFPDGIAIDGVSLADVLADGVVYWQNGQAVLPGTDVKEITGGDVVIKTGCYHNWTDATCVTPKTCSACGETDGEVDADAHAEKVVPGYAATCVKPGLTDGVVCSLCNKTLTEQEEIPVNDNHSYGDDHICECGKVETFTVTVDSWNDHVAVSPTNTTAEYGKDFVTELTNDLQLPLHYLVLRYYVNGQRYEDVTYQDGKLTIPAANVTGDIEIVVRVCVTVTCYANGGEFSDPATGHREDPWVRYMDYGDSRYLLQESSEYLEGHEIVSLNTQADGKGTEYKLNVRYTFTEDLVLYAIWQPLQYTVTINPDNGEAEIAITQDYGTAITAPANPTKDGYHFVKWDQDIPATMPAEDYLVITAIWEAHDGGTATCVSGKLCDTCGEEYGEPDYGNHTEKTVSGKAPTCTEPGLTDGVICSVCGETVTAQEEIPAPGHSYENNVCTICGQENVPVKLDSASLSFKEKIHYNIFFSLGLDETVDLSDMGLIMFDSLNPDGTMDDAIAVYSGAVEIDGKYMVATDGVHAKYMGDTIYFRAYAKLADGSYVYSKTVQYSAVTYAEHILASDEPESAKALVVAMLNYGAAAQMFFGYNTDNLVNAFLTEEQKALPEQYRDDMVNTVPVVAAEKQGIFANNKGFSKRMPAVSFEGAFEINYFFTPAYAPVDGITLYYWTEADFDANEVLTADNATGSIRLEGTGTEQYRSDIGGIAAKSLSENIYVAAIYSDGTTTWTSGVLGYSIGAYCGRLAAKGGAMADLAMATAVYGYHAKQYFG